MDLKQLKHIWQEHAFRPRKRLGQNFLIDKNIRSNILDALSIAADSTVVEIGAGFGVMSFELAERCKRLFAVEKDERVCRIMEPFFAEKNNITFMRADILDVDVCALADKGRVTVCGNVPYYITTPIIEKMIDQRHCIDDVYVVVQEELANRIVSAPGSKDYGSFSCYVQFHAKAKKLIRIKKNSFYPKPQVDSCLLRLQMLQGPAVPVVDGTLMFKVIRGAFAQRRKKAVNSLSRTGVAALDKDAWQDIFEACGIDPATRAEDISLTDYARIADEAAGKVRTW